jgi:hypothetical protein
MVTTTKFPKGLSIGGKKGGDTDVSGVLGVARGSFDPTSASQIELFTLPAGAIPLSIASYGGATGGTNPTVDVGTTGDDDGIANELDADGAATDNAGALMNVQLTADTVIYGKVGASAATGGTTAVALSYIMADL